MKKSLVLLLCLLLIFFALSSRKPTLTVSAFTKEGTAGDAAEAGAMEELEGNLDELLDALDTEALQNYLDTLTDFRGTSVKDKLKQLVTGDASLDYPSLWQALLGLLFEDASVFLPAFALILAVALLCGISYF